MTHHSILSRRNLHITHKKSSAFSAELEQHEGSPIVQVIHKRL